MLTAVKENKNKQKKYLLLGTIKMKEKRRNIHGLNFVLNSLQFCIDF